MWDKRKIISICFAGAVSLVTAAVSVLSIYMIWEKAPAIEPPAQQVRAEPVEAEAVQETESRAEKGLPFNTKRRDGVYTFLLVGNDNGTGNTDTIMVGKLDTVRHSVNFVSIPRDTIINVDWSCRKLNSVYWGAQNNGNSGIEALKRHVKKLVGFDIDCYAMIDLEAFQQVIDVMGGVWFDVPQEMYYEDRGQDLYIDLQPGYQLLDGYQAMGLCRYRSSYVDGDIGRISMQHEFLRALAEQFVSEGSIPNAAEICRIVAENTDTNLTAANIAYFFRQALMCRSEDISFFTAPHTTAYVQNLSYAFLELYDWLNMINECINPFGTAVTEGNLDLVYMHNGNVCCTTVLNGPGYYDLGRTQEAEPAEVYEEEPEYVYIPPEPTPRPYIELFPDAEPEKPEKQPPTNDNWLEEF